MTHPITHLPFKNKIRPGNVVHVARLDLDAGELQKVEDVITTHLAEQTLEEYIHDKYGDGLYSFKEKGEYAGVIASLTSGGLTVKVGS